MLLADEGVRNTENTSASTIIFPILEGCRNRETRTLTFIVTWQNSLTCKASTGSEHNNYNSVSRYSGSRLGLAKRKTKMNVLSKYSSDYSRVWLTKISDGTHFRTVFSWSPYLEHSTQDRIRIVPSIEEEDKRTEPSHVRTALKKTMPFSLEPHVLVIRSSYSNDDVYRRSSWAKLGHYCQLFRAHWGKWPKV